MERRFSPRVEVNVPVDVLLTDGQVFTIPSIDMSYMGISFNCDGWTLQQIFPNGNWSGPKDKINFTLSIKMNNEFILDCDAVVTRFLRLSENEYHIGVQFLGLDDENQRLLIHYVSSVDK
ncbi:MAG: PilZ domain-containing protein [Gammaproteobacteria bacterium]|nr:PilZ domain-containing protein [Gammaproteobacteria bacterium]